MNAIIMRNGDNMSEYKDFEVDFVKRTLKIINEYNGNYEITMLVNCSVGLIILPKESDILNNNKYLNVNRDLTDIRKGKCKDNEDFVRHLRNAIAHCHIQQKSCRGSITNLIFTDRNIEINLKIDELKKASIIIAEAFLNSKKLKGRNNNAV